LAIPSICAFPPQVRFELGEDAAEHIEHVAPPVVLQNRLIAISQPTCASRGGCGACALERATAHLQNCIGRDAKPRSDLAHAFARPQSVTDALLDLRGYRRPAKLFALALGPRKACADSFLDHGALELGEHAHYLKHGLAGRCCGVEPLLVQEEIDPQRVQLGQESNEILKAAAKPVNGPRHHHVELPLGSIAAHAVEGRPAIPAFGAANAVVFVNMDDFAAHAAEIVEAPKAIA
jgi:hypothetical protein